MSDPGVYVFSSNTVTTLKLDEITREGTTDNRFRAKGRETERKREGLVIVPTP